jgi:aconitate hydratase
MRRSAAIRSILNVDGRDYEIFGLDAVAGHQALERLPYALKILLENLLRHEDGVTVTRDDI